MVMNSVLLKEVSFKETAFHRQAFLIPLKRFPETPALGGD
jgi:hypothetical protein